MKSNIERVLILTLLSVIFISCRKRERDVVSYEDYTPKILHCYNNVLDSNEVGMDCGGDCDPCYQTYPPCELEEDIWSFYDGFWVDSVVDKSVQQSGENWIYKAYDTNGSCLMFTFEHKPSVTRSYKVASYPDEQYGYVGSKYTDGSTGYNYKGGGGDLYVNYEDGAYVFSACLSGFYRVPSGSREMSFRMKFD